MRVLLLSLLLSGMCVPTAEASPRDHAPSRAELVKAPWGLPQKLSDNNTTINFELDSTWHRVNGIATGIKGEVWLNELSDPRSVRGEITLPVGQMKTGNFSRDQKMYRVMDKEEFPKITMNITGTEELCVPEVVVSDPCSFHLKATLRIAHGTKELVIPAQLKRIESGYEVKGEFPILWSDFGIKDPSIFIAKIEKEVLVKFRLNLSER